MSSGPRFHLIQAGLQWSGISFGYWCFSGDFWDFSRKAVAFFWHSISSYLFWAYRGRLGLGMGVAAPLPLPS